MIEHMYSVVRKWVSRGMYLAVLVATFVVSGSSVGAADTVQLRWDFEEPAGTAVTDSSGFNNTGLLYNNPTRVPGQSGNAIALDGVNQYVRSDARLA